MIAGAPSQFAIEAVIDESHNGFLLGRFRLWILGEPIGNWDDSADVGACRRWIADLAIDTVDRSEKWLDELSSDIVFQTTYEQAMLKEESWTSRRLLEDPFRRFFISHIGMSALELVDLLLFQTIVGEDRLIWRDVSGDNMVHEALFPAGTVSNVAMRFCDAWDHALSD